MKVCLQTRQVEAQKLSIVICPPPALMRARQSVAEAREEISLLEREADEEYRRAEAKMQAVGPGRLIYLCSSCKVTDAVSISRPVASAKRATS